MRRAVDPKKEPFLKVLYDTLWGSVRAVLLVGALVLVVAGLFAVFWAANNGWSIGQLRAKDMVLMTNVSDLSDRADAERAERIAKDMVLMTNVSDLDTRIETERIERLQNVSDLDTRIETEIQDRLSNDTALSMKLMDADTLLQIQIDVLNMTLGGLDNVTAEIVALQNKDMLLMMQLAAAEHVGQMLVNDTLVLNTTIYELLVQFMAAEMFNLKTLSDNAGTLTDVSTMGSNVQLAAGTGISTTTTPSSRIITIANTGVTSLAATSPVAVSGSTGSVTVSTSAASSIVTDSGTQLATSNQFTISGSAPTVSPTGITTTSAPTAVVISTDAIRQLSSDSGTTSIPTPAPNTITIAGGSGISTSASGGTVTITNDYVPIFQTSSVATGAFAATTYSPARAGDFGTECLGTAISMLSSGTIAAGVTTIQADVRAVITGDFNDVNVIYFEAGIASTATATCTPATACFVSQPAMGRNGVTLDQTITMHLTCTFRSASTWTPYIYGQLQYSILPAAALTGIDMYLDDATFLTIPEPITVV